MIRISDVRFLTLKYTQPLNHTDMLALHIYRTTLLLKLHSSVVHVQQSAALPVTNTA